MPAIGFSEQHTVGAHGVHVMISMHINNLRIVVTTCWYQNTWYSAVATVGHSQDRGVKKKLPHLF